MKDPEKEIRCTGMALVAHPNLIDPNFRETVVLIVHHDEDGAFGLIINRPLRITLQEMARKLNLSWGGGTAPEHAWEGGPVARDTVWCLHDGARGAGVTKDLGNGILFSSDAAAVRAFFLEPAGSYRIFLGYAGWAPRQLEAELAGGFWFLAEVDPSLVFRTPPDKCWERTLSTLGINP